MINKIAPWFNRDEHSMLENTRHSQRAQSEALWSRWTMLEIGDNYKTKKREPLTPKPSINPNPQNPPANTLQHHEHPTQACDQDHAA